MRIVVQKFGGTSVATAEGRERAADWIERALGQGLRPVAVVSALGRDGDPYATDTLLNLAAAVHPELPARELDLLAGCGEIIAGVVMAATLGRRGIDAAVLTGGQAGIMTDDGFGAANIIQVNAEPVRRHLQAHQVVIVAGFQGISPAGDITTLGRGGSDTTASALGGALRAEAIEIFTDVDGIKTADPRLIPDARTLPVATYDEVAQLAHSGARVVHPRAVELAMHHNVPLRIRSTFSDAPGTLVTYSLEAAGNIITEIKPPGVVTAITHVPNLARVELHTEPGDGRSLKMLQALAAAGVSIDLFNIAPERQQFCIEERWAGRVGAILAALDLQPQILLQCAKVSVVGAGMHGRPGVMARIARCLGAAGVEILQTADSHVTISCLVPAAQMVRAVRALYDEFNLG